MISKTAVARIKKKYSDNMLYNGRLNECLNGIPTLNTFATGQREEKV